MIDFTLSLLAVLRALPRSRADLALEILAVRQQVTVLKRKHPRPPLKAHDGLVWIVLRRLWPKWKGVLVIVQPDTGYGGVGLPSVGIGAGDRGAALADLRSVRNSAR